MTYPNKLPIGTLYSSRVFRGVTASKYEATLTYMWGAKGTSDIDAKPYYCIPVLGGLVCEWVPASSVTEPLA